MTMRLALTLAAMALIPASGSAKQPAVKKSVAASESAPPAEVKAAVESCIAHKFETTVETVADGKKRASKVKLCGKAGQSDEDWAETLKDAARKVEGNAAMPKEVKVQIITALNAEVAKIAAAKPIAALPPVAKPPAERLPEYSTLPPLPKAPAYAANSPKAKPGPPPRKPRLTFECYTPGEVGSGGPCIALERETLLTVRADENLAPGTGLRFLRRGDARGEVALAQMRKGQSFRFKLPAELCAGVSSSKVEIEILARGTTSSQVADTLGPYQLRC